MPPPPPPRPVPPLQVYSSKDELKPYGGSLEQFTNTRAYKLTEEPASGTANTVEAFREVDAKQAGAAAAAALLRLPVEDTSDEMYGRLVPARRINVAVLLCS